MDFLAMATKKNAAPSPGQMSKVIGLYQMLMRRNIEHFFPDVMLEPAGDRSIIRLTSNRRSTNFEILSDPEGLGLELEWLKTRYRLLPGAPVPFALPERRLIEAGLDVLDRRFRAIYDVEANLEDMLQYAIEDVTVALYVGTPWPDRIPPAIEALRLAAMSTYENRRGSTGVLLLGSECDPAAPTRVNPPGAPRYNVRLAAIKSIHRMCDGLSTLFLVDHRGDLAWPVDVARWSEQVQGPEPLPAPCARIYQSHARATLSGGHVALVLSQAQEIKVFAHGQLTFAFTDGRWRLLDIASKYEAWCQVVGPTHPADLADRIFHAALNLAEQRRGALFVVLRNPADSISQLVAPEDRILDEVIADDPDDPDNVSPRLAKRALHHLAHAQDLKDLDDSVLEALAGIDGAVVTDRDGHLLSFGAILRVTPETILAPRAVQGARTTAALAASYHGPVLKVSEDGTITVFLGGRRLLEF